MRCEGQPGPMRPAPVRPSGPASPELCAPGARLVGKRRGFCLGRRAVGREATGCPHRHRHTSLWAGLLTEQKRMVGLRREKTLLLKSHLRTDVFQGRRGTELAGAAPGW